jgi:pilus assembly protein FimV
LTSPTIITSCTDAAFQAAVANGGDSLFLDNLSPVGSHTGASGACGIFGTNGANGAHGAQGATGSPGSPGGNGADGTKGPAGSASADVSGGAIYSTGNLVLLGDTFQKNAAGRSVRNPPGDLNVSEWGCGSTGGLGMVNGQPGS